MNTRRLAGFALGPVASAAIGLVTVPAVAWSFSAEDIGRLNIFNVTVSFFLLFSLLGLDQAFVREYHASCDKSRLLKSCFLPGFLLLVIVAITSSHYAEYFAETLYGVPSARLYWMTMAAAAVTFATRFLSLIVRMQERGWAFSMSQLMPKALFLMMIIGSALLLSDRGFIELVYANVVAFVFVLLFFAWNTRKEWLTARFSRLKMDELSRLLNFGAPLILSGLSYWALTATATFALKSFSSLSELANYSLATSFANAAAIIQSIVTVIWTPMVYKWEAAGSGIERVDTATKYALALISTAFVIAGCLAGLTDLLLPSRYADVKYLVVACAAQPLLYTFSVVTSVGIGVARRTGLQLINTLSACVTNVGLTLLLVPALGAPGAATANAIAFFVLFVTNTEASARVWRRFARTRIYVVMSIAICLACCTALFGSLLPVHFALMWALLIPGLIWQFYAEYAALAGWLTGIVTRARDHRT